MFLVFKPLLKTSLLYVNGLHFTAGEETPDIHAWYICILILRVRPGLLQTLRFNMAITDAALVILMLIFALIEIELEIEDPRL